MNKDKITNLFVIFVFLAVFFIVPVGLVYWDEIVWIAKVVGWLLLSMAGVALFYSLAWGSLFLWNFYMDQKLNNDMRQREIDKVSQENELIKSQAMAARITESQFGPILATDSGYEMLIGRLLAHPQAIPFLHGYMPKDNIKYVESGVSDSVINQLSKPGCMFLYGPRGSGKTVALRNALEIRASQGLVSLCDINSPSKVTKFPVIGDGNNYLEVIQFVNDLVKLGESRMKQYSQTGVADFEPLSVFIDEYNSLIQLDTTGTLAESVKMLVNRFRAVKIDVVIAAQTNRVSGLGFRNAGDVLDAFTTIRFNGYEGNNHEAYLVTGKKDDIQLEIPPYKDKANISPEKLYYPIVLEGDYQLLEESPTMDLPLRDKVKLAYDAGYIKPYDIAKYIGCGTGGRQLALIEKYLIEINPNLESLL